MSLKIVKTESKNKLKFCFYIDCQNIYIEQ